MSTIDLASFGFQSISTTGSMAAGSNEITVAANSGFRVGDSIIVEVGGEAGDGMRGTVGVGGVYAATTTDPNLYYTNTMAPKALVAKITGVSADGTTLTLDQSAVAATTNANVYYDNLPAWNAAMASSNESGMTVRIPEGSFAASGALQVWYKTGWTIDGAGKDATELFSPDGARSLTMSIFESDNTTVSDFELRGNARLNGYGLDQYNEYPGGIHFTMSDNGVARDITVTDVFQKAVGVDYSSNVWAYNVDAHLTEGLARYIQWQFQWANSFGGGAVDCSVDSATLTEGFEAFLSQDVSFIRVTGNNAVMAMNSSGNFYIEDAKLDFDANTWISNLQFHKSNPIININSNFAPNDPNMAQGGTIVNVQMHQDGYLNAAGDLLQGIVVNENNSNVTIVGGSYESPDFVATSMSRGPLGVNSIGTATYVNGFTVIGDNSQYNINVADGAVLNSVAGSIGVKTNYQITPASVFEGGAAQASGTVSAAGGFQTPSDLVGAYGVFTFNASTGAWTYTLDDGLAATKALAAGVVTHDVLAVRSLDGSVTRFIDVTVNGANDGGALADEIDLGGGANVAVEGADNDQLSGTDGNNDLLYGEDGDDYLFGTGGNIAAGADAQIQIDDNNGSFETASSLSGAISDNLVVTGQNNGVVNTPPVVIINEHSLNITEWSRVADWISYSDANGDAATQYQFWDGESEPNRGYFWTPDGPQHAAYTTFTVSAAELGNVWIQGGEMPRSETLWVRAFDGSDWSEWDSFIFTTTPNFAPIEM